MKTSLYGFIDRNSDKLNILNLQFALQSGADLDQDLTWFGREKNISDARMYSELGEYSDYFQFCLNNSFFSLQIADGSLVQLYMKAGPHGELVDGSLAFIPKPDNGFDYFRLDYAPAEARHYRHNRYHGHFGFRSKNMRISLFQYPWPDEFLTFLAHIISDEKGRQLEGYDRPIGARITRFHRKRHLQNLDYHYERYNHSLRFSLDTEGGATTPDLRCDKWIEEIA